MIRSFKHKGLEKFATTGSRKGIQPQHAKRLDLLLNLLDSAVRAGSMDFPGSYFHPLKGTQASVFSVRVDANWRMTFRFLDGNAEDVDYLDYH